MLTSQHSEWKTMRESSPHFWSYINKVIYAIDNSLHALLQKVSSFQEITQWFSKSVATMVNGASVVYCCDVKLPVGKSKRKKKKIWIELGCCHVMWFLCWHENNGRSSCRLLREQSFVRRRTSRIMSHVTSVHWFFNRWNVLARGNETSRTALSLCYLLSPLRHKDTPGRFAATLAAIN